MSDVAEVSVKPCRGDTACEVLPPSGGNGSRLCDVQGLQAGRRHWLGSMAAALLGWMILFTALGLLAICTGAALFTNVLVNRMKQMDRENATQSNILMQANKMKIGRAHV